MPSSIYLTFKLTFSNIFEYSPATADYYWSFLKVNVVLYFLSCKTQWLFLIGNSVYPITSLSRSKIQKKTSSFPLLSPEGWSLRGVRINPVFTPVSENCINF